MPNMQMILDLQNPIHKEEEEPMRWKQPIIKVSFQGKGLGELANIQAASSTSSVAKQKVVVMKIAFPPPKKRKMPVVNEEVNKTLMKSPKQSTVRMSSPALALVIVPVDDPEESFKTIWFVCPCFCVFLRLCDALFIFRSFSSKTGNSKICKHAGGV